MSETTRRPKAVFLCDGNQIDRVYARGRKARVAELTDLYEPVVSAATFDEHAEALADRRVAFSTWGMPMLSDDQIDRLESLEAVFYAAGSVKRFAEPYLARGITVVSAWAANAVPVAEFALAQVLLACKTYFRNAAAVTDPESYRAARSNEARGIFGETIALVGAGMIGRKLIELLRPFTLNVVVVDPYLSDADAKALGVTKVSLEEAFGEALVVSNHLPNLPELRGVLNEPLLASMRPGATFINTGRGAQVDEAALAAVFEARPDLTALLDVTYPEPPEADSPLYRLSNVHITTHIAGSLGDEVIRMADWMIDEFLAFQRGQALRYAVTAAQLRTMA
ncbi:MAG: hydroxyacid dehydrogenase [Planctomycetota bacterium]